MTIGDFVHYSTKGICKVDTVEQMKFSGEMKDYYILVPVFDKNSKYYVPTDYDPQKIKIRSAIGSKKAQELICYSKECEPFDWINNVNERKAKNEEVLKSSDHKRIIRLIKTLRHHEEEQKKVGKKMYLSDTKTLKNAVRLISDEIAFVKGEDPQQVEDFFMLAV